MADSKLTALTEDTSPGTDSVIYTIDDPAGSPVDRKVTLSNLFSSLYASLSITLTNKRITVREVDVSYAAAPTYNTDNADIITIDDITGNITSMTTNASGTPVAGDVLEFILEGDGTHSITWGTNFVDTAARNAPTALSAASKRHWILWGYDDHIGKWVFKDSDYEA